MEVTATEENYLMRSKQTKQTHWLLVRKRTVPTELLPLVRKVSAISAGRGRRVVSATDFDGR
jgi:hypothetical protein